MVTTLLRPWENSFRKRGSYLCQSAHTTLFFQPGFCLSSVCLTQVTQLSPPVTRVMLRTILYLHCCCQISLTPGLCLLWSLPFPRRASPMFVYDWSHSPGQPHPANIPPPAKSSTPLPIKDMSAIPGLSRDLQHLLVTQSFPRHQSQHQAQQTSSRTNQSCGPCSSSVTSRKAGPHPCLTGVTAGAEPTLFLPGLRLGRALPSSDTGFSEGEALAGSSSAPGPFMAAR